MFLRKKIALVIALILSLNFFLPELSGTVIFGATLKFEALLTSNNLAKSMNAPIPRYVTNDTDTNQVFFQWDLEAKNTSAVTYLLTYYLPDGKNGSKKIEFAVSQEYEIATVYYRQSVRKEANGNVTFDPQKGTFNMYNHTTGRYQDYTQYLLPGANPDEYNFDIDNNFPVFKIRNNEGFIFQYGGEELYFLWNGNKFQFVTNNMSPGYVYEATLDYYPGGIQGNPLDADKTGSGHDTFTQKIITGLDKTFEMIPVAGTFSEAAFTEQNFDENNFTEGSNYYISNSSDYFFNRNDYLVSGSAVNTIDIKPLNQRDENEKKYNTPGRAKNGIIFRFDLPKTLNKTSFQYTSTPDNSVNLSSDIILVSPGSQQKEPYIIKMQNIVASNPSDRKVVIQGAAGNNLAVHKVDGNDINLINNDGCVQVWIENFESGLLFSNASIGINASDNTTTKYETRNTDLNYKKIYTFLEYNIIPSGEQYLLSFMPYKNWTGTYKLFSNLYGNNNVPIATKKSSDDSELIMFQLSLSTTTENGEDTYRIEFTPTVSGNTEPVRSQDVLFHTDIKDASISLPNDFEVLKSTLIPSETQPEKEGTLNLTLRWTIATKRILDVMLPTSKERLEIVYKLNSSLQQDKANQDNYADLKITIQKNAYFDTNPSAVETDAYPRFLYTMDIVYKNKNKADTTVSVNNGNPMPLLSPNTNIDNPSYYIVPELELAAKRKDNATDVYFSYPNIYFLNLQLYSIKGDETEYQPTSSFVSITLDDISESELPTPEHIAVNNLVTTSLRLNDTKNEVSGDLSFSINGNKFNEYLDVTFAKKSNLSLSYNIYISTDQTSIINKLTNTGKNLTNEALYKSREAASVIVDFDPMEHGSDSGDFNGYLNFSSLYDDGHVNYATSSATNGILTVNGKPAIEALRSGETVMIRGISLTDDEINLLQGTSGAFERIFKLDGLDKNQKYYIYIDFLIDNKNYDPSIHKYSPLSALYAFTTKGDKEQVSEADKKPQAPKFTDKKSGLDWAAIYWEKIQEIKTSNAYDIIEYQIVRIKNYSISNSEMLNEENFTNFWNAIDKNAEKKGFETDSSNILNRIVKVFNITDSNFNDTLTKDIDYMYSIEDDIVGFTDIGLKPNQVYYYYVRTKKTTVTQGNVSAPVYSVWNQLSVTTSNLKEPKNLTVDRSNRDAYDPKTEAILSFDVPLTGEGLNDEFELQYIYKDDSGNWSDPITMPASALIAGDTVDGYTNYRYKITGLKPETNYSFMVRLKNKEGDVSMYSNIAETRTDYDPTDYDNQKDKEDWDNYLKDHLAELLKQNYWVAEDTSSRFTAVYRPIMFNANVNGHITLASSSKQVSTLTYYLPAEAVLAANSAGKGFVITNGDLEIILSPRAFDPNTNNAIKAVIQNVNNKKISDYYIRINITYAKVGYVDGAEAATPQATISFDAVGSKTVNTKWDDTILSLLTQKIESDATLNEASKQLLKMISNETPNEERVLYVANYVKKISADFSSTVNDRLRSTLDAAISIQSLNTSMIISCKQADISETIQGYAYIGNSWVQQETTQMGDKKAIYVNNPGVFIFTKYVLNLKGLDTITGSYGLTGVITKYGLDDFLGKDDTFDINGNATGYMVVGIVSRITGAPKGTDPYSYLSSKGVTVSTRNQYSNISNQEAIHLLMFIYEQKTNTKVSSMMIKNFNLTANMVLDSKYKKSVQAAFELELCTNNAMIPGNPMSVRELLELLKNLNSKLNL